MQRIKQHYVIVGGSHLDMLTPLLDKRFGNPAVTVLYPPTLQERAETVRSLCVAYGLKTMLGSLPDAKDQITLRAALDKFAGQHRSGTAAFNLSGVDALYATPAFAAFKERGQAVFAVEPHSDNLIWLAHPEGDYPTFDVADVGTIDGHLKLHDVRWVSANWSSSMHGKIAHEWNLRFHQAALDMSKIASASENGSKAVRAMHYLAAHQGKAADNYIFVLPNESGVSFVELLAIAKRWGLVTQDGTVTRFVDETSQQFCKGGWLDWRMLYAAMPLVRDGLIQEVALNLKVEFGKGARSEWDVVLLANNNLYTIECKATNDASGVIRDELDQTYAQTAFNRLACYKALCRVRYPVDPHQSRADEYGVKLLALDRGNLTKQLRDWIRT